MGRRPPPTSRSGAGLTNLHIPPEHPGASAEAPFSFPSGRPALRRGTGLCQNAIPWRPPLASRRL